MATEKKQQTVKQTVSKKTTTKISKTTTAKPKRKPLPKIDKEHLKVRVPILKSFKKLRSNYCANFSQQKYFTILDKGLQELNLYKENKEKEKIIEAEKKVKEQKSKKKKLLNLAFFFLNIIFIACFVLFQGKKGLVGSPGDLHANWWFLLVALGLVGLWIAIDSIRFQVLIHKATGINRPLLAYKTSTLGKYYDIITPFSTGGQPFQIFYINKYGIKAGEAVSITMAKYMFQQIAYFILVTVILFANLGVSGTSGSTGETLINIMSWIGYIILSIMIVGICLISLNKKVGVGIVVFFLKMFCKIFKRDYNKMFRNVMRTVTTWQHTMRKYSKSPFIWIFNILASFLFFLVQYSIPFFIYCAFEGFKPEVWIQIITITIMVDLASSFNPLPAGAGVSEISFDTLFKSLFMGSTLWAMLLWRLMTLYIFLFHGVLVLIYDYAIGNRRWAKNKDKWLEKQNAKRLKKQLLQPAIVAAHNETIVTNKDKNNS